MDFFYPFDFEGPLEKDPAGGMSVVFLPDRLIAELPERPSTRPRLAGEIAGRPFTGGLHPAAGGRADVIVNKTRQKQAGITFGDPVRIAFRFDDPDRVDVPPALACALADDDGAQEIWETLTPGTKRGFAHQVASAKTDATMQKRVLAVLAALEEPNPSPYPKRRAR